MEDATTQPGSIRRRARVQQGGNAGDRCRGRQATSTSLDLLSLLYLGRSHSLLFADLPSLPSSLALVSDLPSPLPLDLSLDVSQSVHSIVSCRPEIGTLSTFGRRRIIYTRHPNKIDRLTRSSSRRTTTTTRERKATEIELGDSQSMERNGEEVKECL